MNISSEKYFILLVKIFMLSENSCIFIQNVPWYQPSENYIILSELTFLKRETPRVRDLKVGNRS